MKIHKTPHGIFASENVTFDESTDTKQVFIHAFKPIEKVGGKELSASFAAIDLSRNIFVDLFDDEKNFKKMPPGRQKAFVMAVHAAALKARDDHQFYHANGFSLFIIWLTALIFEQDENRDYIEEQLSMARKKHNIAPFKMGK